MKGLMKNKRFLIIWILLIIDAIAGIAYSVKHYKDETASYFIAMMTEPGKWLIKTLRNMSLSGSVGNIFAIAIYVTVCSIPLIVLVLLIAKKIASYEDIMLIGISVMSFLVIYWGINPSTMPAISDIGDVRTNVGIFITVLINLIVTYIIIKIVRMIGKEKEKNIYMILSGLCVLALFIAVSSIFGDNLLKLLEKFFEQEVSSLNSDDNVVITRGIIVMQYVVNQISFVYLFIVAKIGLNAIPKIKENIINNEIKDYIVSLTKVNNIYVVVVVLTQAALNLTQLVVGTYNNILNIIVTFPIGTIIMAIVLTIIAKMIDAGRELQEENDLFI